MKKAIINILVFTFLFNTIKGQVNSNLYLIQAHTFDDLAGMFQFYDYLYKLDNQILDTIAELSTEKEFLHAVKFSPEFNKVVYYKDGWHYNKDKSLGIIDTKTLQIKTINIEYLPYTIMGGIWAKNSNGCFFVMDLFGKKQNPDEVFLGIDLVDNSKVILDPKIFQNVKLAGSPGGVMRGEDYLIVYTSPSDGKLFIPQTPKIEDRPAFPLEIPDSLQLKKKERVLILINDEKSFVVTMEESKPNAENIGFTKLVIKDKTNDQWFSYKIKGNYQVLRSFENWLAGTVVDENKKLIMDERGAVKDEEVFDRVSPGEEERRNKATLTGTSFDTRTNYMGLYYTGILYLLNVNTKNYIEWNTGQGDSEILLVQNDIVYYRVNDKIYKSSIIKGMELGRPELLIQDERVPDIHWAFIAGN